MRLIDADALLKHEINADRMGSMLVVGKGHILYAPTIDPVRHGRWLPVQDDYSGHYVGSCSECGCEPLKTPYKTMPYRYCPNCGAWMEDLQP